MNPLAIRIASQIIRDCYDSCGNTVWSYMNGEFIDEIEALADDEEQLRYDIVTLLEDAADYIESNQGILNV